MRKFSVAVMLVAMTLLLAACKSGSKSNEQPGDIAVYQVDDVLANGEELVGHESEVEGICTHICAHGARKIFLMGSNDDNTLRIESAGDIGAFDQGCVNNKVLVKGTLEESRIDEAYLKEWEESELAKTAEQHGSGDAGCDTEKKARGESGNSALQRIDDFRNRIAAEKEKSGKEYLSFYHLAATGYEVL